jgi:hypothetical protein
VCPHGGANWYISGFNVPCGLFGCKGIREKMAMQCSLSFIWFNICVWTWTQLSGSKYVFVLGALHRDAGGALMLWTLRSGFGRDAGTIIREATDT